MHTHQVAIPAWRWTHQKVAAVEPLLKRIAAEKILLLSSGGSDWIAGSGRAEKVEGGYRINARKVFSSGAPTGDLLMTSAVLDADGQQPMVLHFGVPMNSPKVKVLDTWRTLGMRGTGSNDVVIENLFVPDAAVAFTRNAGEWHPIFQIIATIAFPLIYSAYLGVAESARDLAIGMASKRPASPHLLDLAGRMDTALRAAQLAHRHMIATAEGNQASAASVNEVMIGRALVAQADFAGARAAYTRVIQSPRGARSEVAAMAQWMIGESYFHQENYEAALAEYARLDAYPFAKWQSAGLLQSAKCQEYLGKWQAAVDLYARLLTTDPESELRAEAESRLVAARNRLAGGAAKLK